jgi:hypothetical protein
LKRRVLATQYRVVIGYRRPPDHFQFHQAIQPRRISESLEEFFEADAEFAREETLAPPHGQAGAGALPQDVDAADERELSARDEEIVGRFGYRPIAAEILRARALKARGRVGGR